jgi:hypothetical protein
MGGFGLQRPALESENQKQRLEPVMQDLRKTGFASGTTQKDVETLDW